MSELVYMSKLELQKEIEKLRTALAEKEKEIEELKDKLREIYRKKLGYSEKTISKELGRKPKNVKGFDYKLPDDKGPRYH